MVSHAALVLGALLGRGLRWCARERGAEVPEYVIVVAVVAMLAVVGLVAVKTGLIANLDGIANCLAGTAAGTASSCA
jgi:Flp pilus assembly pilin Flp